MNEIRVPFVPEIIPFVLAVFLKYCRLGSRQLFARLESR